MNTKLFPLAAFGCAVLVAFTPATQAASLNEKLMQCAVLKDSLERLVCYDQLTEQARTAPEEAYHAPTPRVAPVVPAARQAQPTPAQASAPVNNRQPVKQADPEDSFGKEHMEISKNSPERMRFTVDKLDKNAYGAHVITFSNGQKWKQTDDTTFKLKEGDDVIVSRGMFNAFYLKKPNTNKSIKVKRMD